MPRTDDETRRVLPAYATTCHQVEQTLGKALRYPEYGPEMFTDGVPDGSVCVADHTPESIAAAAAGEIERLRALIDNILDHSAFTHAQIVEWRERAGLS
jgi:hypothetical protein